MEEKNNKLKALIIAGILVIIAAALILTMPALKSGKADESSSSQTDELAEQNLQEKPETAVEESEPSGELLATVFCASDYQSEEHWDTPANNLTAILRSVTAAGKTPDQIIICGDYTNDRNLHDYQLSPDESIAELKEIVRSELPGWSEDDPGAPSDDAIIIEQGNHDAMTDSITESGLHEYDDYLVYVINTQEDFPWKQGKTSGCLKKVRAFSKKLDECLSGMAQKGETRPLIIAGHVPLHFTARTSSKHTTGDNLYSSILFDTINKYGDSLNIIFLFGHNHTKGWDCYLGGSCVYKAPGDTILVPHFDESDITSDKYTKKTLKFTYMNAGYVGHYMNCGPGQIDDGTWKNYKAADMTLTGTVIEIYSDRIEISRWDAGGMHNLGSDGEGNPYKGGIDKSLIPVTEHSVMVPSPQSINRY